MVAVPDSSFIDTANQPVSFAGEYPLRSESIPNERSFTARALRTTLLESALHLSVRRRLSPLSGLSIPPSVLRPPPTWSNHRRSCGTSRTGQRSTPAHPKQYRSLPIGRLAYSSERLNCRCWLGGMRRLVQLVRRAACHARGRSTAIESADRRQINSQRFHCGLVRAPD